MTYSAIPRGTAGFFFSPWLTMMFWGVIAPEFDMKTIGYPLPMLATIAVWLVIAPLAGATAKQTGGRASALAERRCLQARRSSRTDREGSTRHAT